MGEEAVRAAPGLAAPGRLTEDARLLSGWLGSDGVSTSVVFSCFNQQNIVLPKEKKKSNHGSFWDALTYQEGLAEVLFHIRSLNWREKDRGRGRGAGGAIQVKQALDWPGILKVYVKNPVRFRAPATAHRPPPPFSVYFYLALLI